MKFNNDKYYTDRELTKRLINLTFEKIGRENITDIIEPSAGNGSFSDYLVCTAYDIEPEQKKIIQQDYLLLETPYKKGRLIIGNPPFGQRMTLSQKFFKQAVQQADYIAFVLPISQLKNQQSMYEFDLCYSEDLGKLEFSTTTKETKSVHCCFNIYLRPEQGLNSKQTFKLEDIEICRNDSSKYKLFDYDIRLAGWGNSCAGKILNNCEMYALEYKIKIKNRKLVDDILHVLETVDWTEELNSTAMLKIQQYHIHQVLKKYVIGIK